MLASHLLSILMLLQTRGRMSAAALAREFEVSVRTIHRDVDQLSAAGVPVFANRGRGGGFQLMDGYRTNLTGLSQSEAESLFLAGLSGPAAQLSLAETLTAARPAKFDLPGYWQKTSRDCEAGLYHETAHVRLSQKGLARLEAFGPTVMEAATRTAGPPDRSGRVRCRLPIESHEVGVRELLRLGEEVEILGPPELRDEMARVLAAFTQRHAVTPRGRRLRAGRSQRNP
jgi:predicted DNA-binding transcriptional regulator YafY